MFAFSSTPPFVQFPAPCSVPSGVFVVRMHILSKLNLYNSVSFDVSPYNFSYLLTLILYFNYYIVNRYNCVFV